MLAAAITYTYDHLSLQITICPRCWWPSWGEPGMSTAVHVITWKIAAALLLPSQFHTVMHRGHARVCSPTQIRCNKKVLVLTMYCNTVQYILHLLSLLSAGAPGKDGADGIDGADGRNGARGPPGPIGPAGEAVKQVWW
jgi:hypothetical protein